jgi:nitroreductase
VDVWDAILARRNVRDYTSQPIEPADLDQILEAGRRAPSSRNSQPWDFIVVTGRAELTELARVWRGGGHVARSAATVALLGPGDEDSFARARYDLGQATMAMMLAAAGLGIGSGHSAVGDQDLCRELLGYPASRRCGYLIAFGYPAGRPVTPIRHPDRRPFDDVVHRGRW